MLKTENILGIKIINSNMYECLKVCSTNIVLNKKKRIITINPEILTLSQKDKYFYNILNTTDYIVPDGMGIILLSKILNKEIHQRITGIDLTEFLLNIANKQRWKIYLLGSTDKIIKQTYLNIKERFPYVQIKYHHGYFNFQEEELVIKEINEFNPNILLVGLGAKKQEEWITRHYDNLNFNLVIGVGGTFDIISNEIKRSPYILRKMGLEWLFRLFQQPFRIKRSLFLIQFILILIKTTLKRKG